jgi:hypothetical protein
MKVIYFGWNKAKVMRLFLFECMYFFMFCVCECA